MNPEDAYHFLDDDDDFAGDEDGGRVLVNGVWCSQAEVIETFADLVQAGAQDRPVTLSRGMALALLEMLQPLA